MITITIETENAAFTEGWGYEVARILRKLADQVENETDTLALVRLHLPIMDYNGNRVGDMEGI